MEDGFIPLAVKTNKRPISKRERVLAKRKALEPVVVEVKKTKKAANAATAVVEGVSNVLYVGHLPDGFYEEQIGNFFGQFGKVERVKVARSTRTAASKGYGWVRFADPEVASIAVKGILSDKSKRASL
jgi:nucleolar protein 15